MADDRDDASGGSAVILFRAFAAWQALRLNSATARAVLLAIVLAFFVLLPYRSSTPHGAADVLVAYSHVVEARLALEEGQFPIRAAPWQWERLQYPVFQFYSPLVYTLLGGVDLLLRDPWNSIRLALLIALILAGFGAYRLGHALEASEETALLCAGAYLLLPYLAINIQARGAIAETFAQCLLPWCALALWTLLKRPSVRAASAFALAGAALIHTHLITATYFLLTCGIGLTVYLSVSREWRWIPWFAAACAGALGASAWILWPIAATTNLLVAIDQTADPYGWAFLSKWWSLLSPVSLSPTGRPIPSAQGLHPSFGGPAIVAFVLLGRRMARERTAPLIALSVPIVLLAFLVWSPVNVWRYLPEILKLPQFPYRLLAQTGWLTIPALAWGLQPYRERFRRNWPLLAALLVAGMLLDITYLVKQVDAVPAAYFDYLDRSPTFGYARNMYLPRMFDKGAIYLDGSPVALADPESYLRLHEHVSFDAESLRHQPGAMLRLQISATNLAVQPNVFVVRDGNVVASYPILSRSATVDIPLRRLFPDEQGLVRFSLAARPPDSRQAGLKLMSAVFLNPGAQPAHLLAEARRLCRTEKGNVVCTVHAARREWWQIPILQYPDLLEVKLDGVEVPSHMSPSSTEGFFTPLAAVEIPPGTHVVTASFRGSRPADGVSIAIAFAVLIGLASKPERSDRRGPRTSP